jgi:hypothetical protein
LEARDITDGQSRGLTREDPTRGVWPVLKSRAGKPAVELETLMLGGDKYGLGEAAGIGTGVDTPLTF